MLGPEITPDADHFIEYIDILGTVAFAASGVLRGWEKKFNLIGVAFLAAATACGGGTIRDILRGRPVPFFLQEWAPILWIIATVVILYVSRFAIRWLGTVRKDYTSTILEIADAIGLGVFAIIGAKAAMHNMHHDAIAPFVTLLKDDADIFYLQPFTVVLFAILTGAGGGILRDVVANRTPYAFSASWYAAFPALGGILFYIMCRAADGPINFTTVLFPTLAVMITRLAYWRFWEYEREQYAATVLIRDQDGRYLMEAGASGYMNFIGGKWQSEDGYSRGEPDLFKTALREVREEIGLSLKPEELKRIKPEKGGGRNGYVTYIERSIRTGEKVRYHMGLHDCIRIMTPEDMSAIERFRETPVLPRDRLFAAIDPISIVDSANVAAALVNILPGEGATEIKGEMKPVSLSMIKRIRGVAGRDICHEDGSPILLPRNRKNQPSSSQ